MSAADALLAILWIGLTLYAMLGGADFGAGLWDLLAGGTERGRPQRDLIEHSIGPVWEANHVWLIFVITLFWTAFPTAFALFAATLYIPLTLAALGIIARGAAFAFRKASEELWLQRVFGAAFAFSSVVTPFFLGTVAGAVASGRVPARIGAGDIIGSWWNPTSLTTGALAVGACAYLAAVYLCADARRAEQERLADGFRTKALTAGVLVGVATIAALLVVRADAPELFAGLTGRALPVAVVSVLAGVASLGLLAARSYVFVRVTAALAVTAVLWGWGIAQYPNVLPGLTVAAAAGDPTVLSTALWVLGFGALLLLPSLVFLYTVFQRDKPAAECRSGAGDSRGR